MDSQIRLAAFNWIDELTLKHGDVISRSVLEEGFIFQGQKITVIGAKGIWKPKHDFLKLRILKQALR